MAFSLSAKLITEPRKSICSVVSGYVPLTLSSASGTVNHGINDHMLPEFSRYQRVIAFEQQGYGHTADIADRSYPAAEKTSCA
jgi:hypothetical protein